MRFIALIVCLALATPALAAEPWEGVWTNNWVPSGSEGIVDPCNPPESSDWGPMIFSKGPITSRYRQCDSEKCVSPKGDIGTITWAPEFVDSWTCYIGKITNVHELEAWIFDVECGGEGTMWNARTMAMRTKEPDGLAVYNLIAPSVTQLYRCPSPSPPRPKP